MNNQSSSCSCKRNFGSFTGLCIVGIAIVYMLGSQGYITWAAVDVFWPILLGLIGVVKIAQSNCGCDGNCVCK